MRILIINEVCGHTSTGKICTDIAKKYLLEGHEVRIAFGRDGYVPEEFKNCSIRIGNDWTVRNHALYTRITDKHGLLSKKATEQFLRWADTFNPDMLWMHNLHGYYINYEMLFAWIKRREHFKVYWTLHDCWSFTGHCSHYSYINCDLWMQGCHECPQKKEYPASFLIDSSKENYRRKKRAFTGVADLTIITPSYWLEKQVKRSFLSEYRIEVIHNKIDKSVFKPTIGTYKRSEILEDKKIVLGVANVWNERKGLNDFIKLSQILDDKYKIVLVGLSKSQIRRLPKEIVGIAKTKNQAELAQLYSAADCFVNLTYEDTFPTVNLESEACGTRVITYNTGGAPETIKMRESIVVEQGDIFEVKKQIEER